MTPEQISKELAEEIRTNSALRHRLGMVEGSESGVISETEIGITTAEGEQFAIVVEEI